MISFAIASLLPVVLIAAALIWGGAWGWLSLTTMTTVVFLLDRLGREGAGTEKVRGHIALQCVLALSQFLLILGFGAAVPEMAWHEALSCTLSLGLFMGQISHPNAHELIHRNPRFLRLLGNWIYGTMLIGHHASAHLRVHHIHVGTPKDPNTARTGEGFYRFWARAAFSSFWAGLVAETALRNRRQTHHHLSPHPYVGHVLRALVTLLVLWGIGSASAVVLFVAAAFYAHMQIYLADYVQHYGLIRQEMAPGRYEPVGPQHSWNAPQWYSSAMMLNAPRHSDHHMHPGRVFPKLTLSNDMPILPRSLPVMGAVALVPPLYRRMMSNPLAKARQRQQAGLE